APTASPAGRADVPGSNTPRVSWSRAVFRWRYLSTVVGMLVVVGAGLRLWLLVDASPAFLGYPDSGGYIATAATRLSGNVFQPVGYPLFLRLVHLASARLAVPGLVHHVLAMGSRLLY